MSLGISPTKPKGLDLVALDEDGHRWAVMRDGVVTFVGTAEDCRARLAIMSPGEDRGRQDGMLNRACR